MDAFPDSNNGNMVLLTTRNKEVALCADANSHPHQLRFLNEDESCELFLKKVSSGHETYLPGVDAESWLREEILGKYQGLPLAVVAIGGLLSRRKELREWQRILKGGWQLFEGENRMSGILALSYRDLPYYLKPCFLYLGIFPEDSKIPARKLIQLWAAEGFFPERGELALEEMGEELLQVQAELSKVVASMISYEAWPYQNLIKMGFQRLAKLRKLGINIDPIKASIETAWKWIMRSKSLESLYVYTEGCLGPMPPLDQYPPKLYKSKLEGKLTQNHPSSVFLELPRNLTKLTLQQSQFTSRGTPTPRVGETRKPLHS
ncbi:hypothetical protein ACLOJK_015750 [Asimina triloba]